MKQPKDNLPVLIVEIGKGLWGLGEPPTMHDPSPRSTHTKIWAASYLALALVLLSLAGLSELYLVSLPHVYSVER